MSEKQTRRLVLGRIPGQKILITDERGDKVAILELVHAEGGYARIAVHAPPQLRILRAEIAPLYPICRQRASAIRNEERP